MKRYALIKLIVVCIFIGVAYMICDLTRYYVRPIYYKEDEIRVIINDSEVTRNLPDKALFIDEKIMLSFDTIKKYFDEYIYFDEKYQTVIITSDVDVVKLKLDEKKININGNVSDIKTAACKIEEDIYVPIEEVQDVYNIEVLNNEKIIITTNDVNYKKIEIENKGKVKLYKRETSLTTSKLKSKDIITVFETDEEKGYSRVRTVNGDLGYIKTEKTKGNIIFENVLKEENIAKEKINLTWEYAENYTPNREGQNKLSGVNVISPTWIYMKNENGEIRNTVSTSYIEWANKVGYDLWPTLKNDLMGLDKTSMLVTDMKAREKIINNVVSLAKQYDFEGINLDFENMYMKDKDEFSEFVREFSATLRRNSLVASVDVNVPDGSETWSLCYDHKPIADAADYMILMAYDQYSLSQDGPVASLSWVENNIKKLLEREEVDNEKFILGVPFYSKYRKNKITISGDEEIQSNISKTTLYMQNAKNYLNSSKYKDVAVWDEAMGQYYIEYRNQNTVERIWIEEEKSLKEKVELINKYNLAGVASWRWGFETLEAWKTINNTL